MHPGLKVLLSSLGTAGSCLRNPKKPSVPQITDRACPPLSPHSCIPACSPRGHRTQHQGSQLHPNIVCVLGGLLPEQLLCAPDRATAAIWQCHGPQDPSFWCPSPLALLGVPILAVLCSQGRSGVGRLGNCFPRSMWQLAQDYPLCVHSHPVAAAGPTWSLHCPPGQWMGSKAHRVSSICPEVPCPGPLGPSQCYARMGGILTPSPVSSVKRKPCSMSCLLS